MRVHNAGTSVVEEVQKMTLEVMGSARRLVERGLSGQSGEDGFSMAEWWCSWWFGGASQSREE